MIISGLLLTLSEDARLAEGAEAALRVRPEFTLAERSQRWLPVAIEVENVRASRDLHDWLNALPGVEFVDVVHVSIEEEAEENSAESCIIDRPHPGPLPQERENPSPSHSKTRDWVGRTTDREARRIQMLSPLPGGEGQGEGVRHTIRQSTIPTPQEVTHEH